MPHSEIPGSKPVRGSPGLIAAYHVLHRLSAPRHPLDALQTLDRSHRQRAPRELAPSPDPRIGAQNLSLRLGCLRRPPFPSRERLPQGQRGLASAFSKRPVLLQTHPGAQAVKLGPRLVARQVDDERKAKADLARPLRSFVPGPSTECVSSSRCQISTPRARALPLGTPPRASRQTDKSHRAFRPSNFLPALRDQPRPRLEPASRFNGGARRNRTDDLMLAKHALSQLSYSPVGSRR